jgi:hypothetical protein
MKKRAQFSDELTLSLKKCHRGGFRMPVPAVIIGGLRTEVHDQIGDVRVEIGGLRKEMHEGFAAITRRLDQIIETQLDEHATRIKKLETAVFSK